MEKKITDDKPELQNRVNKTGSDGLASFDEWMAHKQLCRRMFVEAELSLRVSREDYLAQLETVVSRHKGMVKGSNKV
ncbi:hypothetical protein [Herminiimonas fonticola]|uniref:Uncharacterized protein n=1 Tax=Herminiimonas fonticola TaxID=303380 RepID=A0A4R6G2B7_9BURK|nr:hypothetical protein [Herminiimonas fonticola]RBA22892.1 hypothetical protein Hfont_2934 [Herminiimonas fonticola]TDN87684.1 hypothetical protein EV677_2941 [Herminiimonas fonticola]